MLREYANNVGVFLDGGGAVFNIKHPNYGATGDGVVDDRASIVLADTAAGGSGTLYLPPGSYLVGSNLTITSPVIMSAGAVFALLNRSSVTDIIKMCLCYAAIVDDGGTFRSGGIADYGFPLGFYFIQHAH